MGILDTSLKDDPARSITRGCGNRIGLFVFHRGSRTDESGEDQNGSNEFAEVECAWNTKPAEGAPECRCESADSDHDIADRTVKQNALPPEDICRVHGAADEGYRSIKVKYRREGADAGRDDGMTAELAARMHTRGQERRIQFGGEHSKRRKHR